METVLEKLEVYRSLEYEKKDDSVRGMKPHEFHKFKIGGDIYGLAYAGLIDPKQIDQNNDNMIPNIPMTSLETNRLFSGYLLVVGF